MSEIPETDTEAARAAEWFFFRGGPGSPRYGGDPTKHAVDHDTEAFVREVLQNANDQALSNSEPTEVTFRFRDLTGADRDAFLRALRWHDGLAPRLESVSGDDRGQDYSALLNRLQDEDAPLRVLVVEDQNTTGLTGEWSDDSNYAALVRDELYSSKQDERAGGSYGLGKSVLWTFSGASTVVFNSNLADEDASTPRQRLIARTKLPTHSLGDGRTYQGAGWLSRPIDGENGTRPASLWDDRAAELASDLYVDRPATPGTSALVVDYRDPTRDERRDLDTLATEFERAAAKYFWPAIRCGDLQVGVAVEGDTRVVEPREVPLIRPFVDCFERRYDGDGAFDAAEQVDGVDLPVSLPPRANDTPTPDGHVRLAARRASPADDDTYLNRVALFRGAGMVVKYYDQSRIAFGDRHFQAVLACGEARSETETTESDREIERFLRFAEPPAHDEWESTENLRTHYKRGFRTALDDIFDTTQDGLRHLIAQRDTRGQVLTDRVRNRFPIHGGNARQQLMPSPSTLFDIESYSSFDGQRWVFDGEVTPTADDFEGWRVEVSLTGVGEDGARYDEVPVDSIESSHPDVTVHLDDGIGYVQGGPDAQHATFEGVSELVGTGDLRYGEVGETQLEIRAELEEGGDSS